MTDTHPAVWAALQRPKSAPYTASDARSGALEHVTSLSLARALAVGCLSRLDPSLTSINIWDPAAGEGFAGSLLANALESTGISVRYRGQEINTGVAESSQRHLELLGNAEIAVGNTLQFDAYDDFIADLVLVDAPWGMEWSRSKPAVQSREESGAFGFGLPQDSDSTWLFISLALEKLRPTVDGGGRVAALVNPGALSAGGASEKVRRKVVDAGLLESVTRLAEGLAPNTSIPLYLLTFTNRGTNRRAGKVMIADFQTQFMTEHQHRSMPVHAFEELESGLRTGRPGPRNRTVDIGQFTRREALVRRVSAHGRALSWRIKTFNDTAIDDRLLASRYGPSAGVQVDGEIRESLDLNPGRIFDKESNEFLNDLRAKDWPSRRLSSLLAREPEPVKSPRGIAAEGQLFVPTTRVGTASTEYLGTESNGRVLSIQLDSELVEPTFLAAWLNSEQGIASRRRAIDTSSSGTYPKTVRSDANSLMRWADELIIPLPNTVTQLAMAVADERLQSFQAELKRQRESVWADPESAKEVVDRITGAFEDSLTTWIDQLPFPVASALWTAQTATSSGEQQQAYLHAWEAIVTFHATVLLSASRNDPGSSSEVETSIRHTLQEHHLGIERASFGTWMVIIQRLSKMFREVLERDDPDDVARLRRAFGDLGQSGIERLISKDLVKKFTELNTKRNRWLGHAGFTPEEERRTRVASLVSDLTELRQLLGNVWTQLLLVRAGSSVRKRDGFVQTAEVAVGSRSPFIAREFKVGDQMLGGELYLVRDESESPLRLGHFVQLRAAPNNAQYTTYFYDRTEGSHVRMVSYQYGPEGEAQDDLTGFDDDFGALMLRSE